jgi:glycopeptide antibiotics resistance protein
MGAYIEPIKTAAIFFPFIAIIMSIPFILIEYHKFGSISFLKSLVLYSFVLYLLCAYFLVILPLPDRSCVAQLTTPRCQWVPFQFIRDFIRETPLKLTHPASYIAALKHNTFIVPVYNILLTIPFGIYLRYYFGTSLKKTLRCSFLLSLFFELTQLSGLYFIYSRSYRLFDVDDLMLNTLGGVLGYLCAPVIIRVLPTRKVLEEKSMIRGQNVSGLRRTTALMLDMFLYSIVSSILALVLDPMNISFELACGIAILLYYVALPCLMKGATLGERFLNLRIKADNEKKFPMKLLLRVGIFVLSYIIIPVALIYAAVLITRIPMSDKIQTGIICFFAAIVASYYLCIGVKYLFTNRPMLYEKLSQTRMVSTIEVPADISAK